MDDSALSASPPHRLEPLLALDGRTVPWTPGELPDLLRHQLSAPLAGDLPVAAPRGVGAASGGTGRDEVTSGGTVAGFAARLGRADPSFADLLTAPAPPLGLLRLVKEFGKRCDADPDRPLPPEVASVLYFAAIAAAYVRHGARITALGDDALRAGVDWALAQPWLDGRLRPLFAEARERLAPGGGAAGGGAPGGRAPAGPADL